MSQGSEYNYVYLDKKLLLVILRYFAYLGTYLLMPKRLTLTEGNILKLKLLREQL